MTEQDYIKNNGEFDATKYWSVRERDISVLEGQTIKSASYNYEREEIYFETEEGYTYKMYHNRECCERVVVESIVGDLVDLVGQKIEVAEMRSNEKDSVDGIEGWTFYCIRCVRTSVDIRWFGESNGYYSVGVSFERVK